MRKVIKLPCAGTVAGDDSASSGTDSGGKSDARRSCLFRVKHVAGVCYAAVCPGLKRLVEFISNPPVPSAIVPLVHILILLAALSLPWGLSYDAVRSRDTKEGPIVTLCGLNPLDDNIWHPAKDPYWYDYYTWATPANDFQPPPPDFSPPPFPPPPPPSTVSMPPHFGTAMGECLKFKEVFDYSLDSELPKSLISSLPNNTIFVAIVIQDVDVKKFVASALLNAWFGTTPAASHKATNVNEGDSITERSFNVLNNGSSLVVNVNSAEVIKIATKGINDQASKALDNVPVFAERHLRMYPFDKYRFHIRASFSLTDDDGTSYRLPFVVAITQKGAGFQYYVRNPQKWYLVTKDKNPAGSEVFFTVWAKRPGITRFVSIFIVLLMWCLAILTFTSATYAGFFGEEEDITIDQATFAATVLFALPALRNMQPSIPAEVGLVVDMSGFIWNMTMVAVACMIYLWVIYSRLVWKRRKTLQQGKEVAQPQHAQESAQQQQKEEKEEDQEKQQQQQQHSPGNRFVALNPQTPQPMIAGADSPPSPSSAFLETRV
ncbi:hypothetical protein Vretimale_19611 [Volvox reticuliferus]|nr:hypothetical protein Vretimale_19611 [Volvox reticuliferus]